MTASFYYPGFDYPATELLKYITVLNDFTIMLKDGDIIKHTPDDDEAFKRWLDCNHIQNIREEQGWAIE